MKKKMVIILNNRSYFLVPCEGGQATSQERGGWHSLQTIFAKLYFLQQFVVVLMKLIHQYNDTNTVTSVHFPQYVLNLAEL